ncbi:receptor-type tyrosine-protein phosphatase N2-like [Branchiostoma floridae]|uniref:Receptor-type tyrosine-protein phosphatase N2-like n=1 Tax=Branchiostoma floridae TaxID=7739 RepID=A0A9J7LT26_BRAFL|nr:receptor-type tyrosine-protein phosphatase N2-like [Branchiostoma floridae]
MLLPRILAILGVIVCVCGGGRAERGERVYGCLFQKDLCRRDEICVVDNLFGSCQEDPVEAIYSYNPSSQQLKDLRDDITELVTDGYGWREDITQATIGGHLNRIHQDYVAEPPGNQEGYDSLGKADPYLGQLYPGAAQLSTGVEKRRQEMVDQLNKQYLDLMDRERALEQQAVEERHMKEALQWQAGQQGILGDDRSEEFVNSWLDDPEIRAKLKTLLNTIVQYYGNDIDTPNDDYVKKGGDGSYYDYEGVNSPNRGEGDGNRLVWGDFGGGGMDEDGVPDEKLVAVPKWQDYFSDADMTTTATKPLTEAGMVFGGGGDEIESREDPVDDDIIPTPDADMLLSLVGKELNSLLDGTIRLEDLTDEEYKLLAQAVRETISLLQDDKEQDGDSGGQEDAIDEETRDSEGEIEDGTGEAPDGSEEDTKENPEETSDPEVTKKDPEEGAVEEKEAEDADSDGQEEKKDEETWIQEDQGEQKKSPASQQSFFRNGPPSLKFKSEEEEKEEKPTIDSKAWFIPIEDNRGRQVGIFDLKDAMEASVERNHAFLVFDRKVTYDDGTKVRDALADIIGVPTEIFSDISVLDNHVSFLVRPNDKGLNASTVAHLAENNKEALQKAVGMELVGTGIGSNEMSHHVEFLLKTKELPLTRIEIVENAEEGPHYLVLTVIVVGCLAGVLVAVIAIYFMKRSAHRDAKLQGLTGGHPDMDATADYQELCRQRMASKATEKPEPMTSQSRFSSLSEERVRSPSSRSSTSSWSEEPVSSNMDISTGHIVLAYMEDHLKNKDRLEKEWQQLQNYEPDIHSTVIGLSGGNAAKNRVSDAVPYDHSRVILNDSLNIGTADYINASTITDHDPRNHAYIATQGPLETSVCDFWQMVWEQGSVVIVMLCSLQEGGSEQCCQYWPEEGNSLYHIYEVHLVSEHIWCEDFLVRSFYLKNIQTGETRTVTQFHFLSWPEGGIPATPKALLEFRRKVNKCYRGKSCPIVVHCSDGCGRTGTYCLVDMVLNRMTKGAKEIDIAATLEHIRDQRPNMVKSKDQFEFALTAVAEEVNAILKALPQ